MNMTAIAAAHDASDLTERGYAPTINLSELAGIAEGDQIRISGPGNKTQELFETTLDLVGHIAASDQQTPAAAKNPQVRFIPQMADLRARFKFADVLGSYATLNALLDRFAPVAALAKAELDPTTAAELTSHEVSQLRNYRNEIELALKHAHGRLKEYDIKEFDSTELGELSEILNEARTRYQAIENLLGARLIHDVEKSVEQLHEFHQKIAGVQRTISGIFLVDSEIMFVPSARLVEIVDTIFCAIGDPYVADHIDGTLLLAARNLLIQVVSFYAYYGREQIYRIFETRSGKESRRRVASMVSNEIKQLFSACKTDNRLILTRVMSNTEREFEVSIEAIEREACHRAIMEVEKLAPPKKVAVEVKKKSILSRLSDWLFH